MLPAYYTQMSLGAKRLRFTEKNLQLYQVFHRMKLVCMYTSQNKANMYTIQNEANIPIGDWAQSG